MLCDKSEKLNETQKLVLSSWILILLCQKRSTATNLLWFSILIGIIWAMNKKQKHIYIFIWFCSFDSSIFNFSCSSILLKVCALLKNRAQEIRDIARSTLAKIIEDLGVHYLQYILKELQTTLVRGYQVNCIIYLIFRLGWNSGIGSLKTSLWYFGSALSKVDPLRQQVRIFKHF